ncbi:GntR family transcriptional regulator [Pigmentiphaga soli]
MQQAHTYKSLTQIVLEHLREQIYEGKRKPGAKLNIADIAKEFEISHLPVREALRNLEAEGLIEIHHNRGAVVKMLTPEDVREIFLIRAPLEETAAAEATQRWRARAELGGLERILQQMDKKTNTPEWYRLHHNFHNEVLQLANLPRIKKLIEVYRGQMRAYVKLYLSSPPMLAMTQSEHYEMLECMVNRDADGIRLIVREHLARPVREILKILQADAAQAQAPPPPKPARKRAVARSAREA